MMVEGEHALAKQMIAVEVIPHAMHHYETIGDYFNVDGVITVRVSDMGNRDYQFLVAIHEIVEAYLCEKRGITTEEIDTFDMEFEANRKPGDLSEPGDDRSSPYANEHCVSTAVERLVCAAAGVSWQDYEQACQRLSP